MKMNKINNNIIFKEINKNILNAIKKNENYVIIKKIQSHQLPRKLIHTLSYGKSLFAGYKRNLFKNKIILDNINNKEIISLFNTLKTNNYTPSFSYWNESESNDEGIMLIIKW